jgi:DNA-binding GntR family transcriptional regulator
MSSVLPAIQSSSLRRNVADALRTALLQGRYRPGEELSDSALAAEFRVSRGPVREGLMLLVEEGLVLHRHNRGFEVPKLDRENLNQIATVRHPLEVLALELARERMDTADLTKLEELKAGLLGAFRGGGIGACALPDYEFHAYIWQKAGNQWLEAALRRISMPYFAYVSAFNLGRPGHSIESLSEMHQRVIDYLAGTSSETADECIAFHLALDKDSEQQG